MKAIIQRVTSASVVVDGQVVSSIGRGLCVLIGIHRTDTRKELEYIAKKLLSVRLFDDPNTGKRWDKSVKDLNLEVLCVSQFTLYHILKGNKLDFHLAMSGEPAKNMYYDLLSEVRKNYCEDGVKDGQFGATMEVNIANDGPVTIELESMSPVTAASATE
jgi:D-tyrosyl-tRNA(Tyr) deacylase